MRVAICSFLCLALGGSALHFKRAETTMEVLSSGGPGSQAADFIWGGGDLLLVGVTASCSNLLGTFDASSLQEAMRMCKSEKSCNFYVWDGDVKRAQLCQGDSPDFTRGTGSHVAVGVRAAAFATPGFAVATNYQAVCETNDIVDELRGVFDMQAAAAKCSASEGCTHFTLSTVAGLDGMLPASQANTLWMCSGKPALVYHAGWLAAARASVLPPRLPVDVAPIFDGPTI